MCGELLILGKSVIRHTQQRYCEFVHQKHRPARNRLAVVRHWPDKIRAWLLANAETLARVRFLTPVTMLASHRGERLARHLSGACLSANSMSMNPRRAAVLALVGWYLIAPQIVTPLGRKPYVDTYAPYWAWGVLHNFKSQDKCERAQRIAQIAAQNGIPISFSGPLPAWWQENNPPIYWLVQ